MGGYSQDNANLSQMSNMQSIMAGSGQGYSQPNIGSMMGSYGGSVQPSENGYPMFSSSQSNGSAPSGYASGNPVDSTPSVIAQQARMQLQQTPPNPMMPTPPNSNPWNIRQSSTPGPMDYPQPGAIPPAKINVS